MGDTMRVYTITPGELAREMLEFFGPDGEHWEQGQLIGKHGTALCFHGAASKVVLGAPEYATGLLTDLAWPFADVVRQQYPEWAAQEGPTLWEHDPMAIMEIFNDKHAWPDIRLVLEKVAAGE